MTKAYRWLVGAVAAFAVSCPFVRSQNPQGCLTFVDPSVDYFPDKVAPDDSSNWSVEYANTYKIVTNKDYGASYLLYQCGTTIPPDELANGGHSAILPIPLQNGIALTGTTQIPFIELLGLRTEIVAYIGWDAFISSPCLLELIDDGFTTVISDPTSEAGMNATLALQDVVVFSDQYVADVDLLDNVEISASSETSNAGTFEWIEFYSVFFNREAQANQIVNETKSRYECVAENADRVVADTGERPVVLWAYYSYYCGGWDVAECPNYYCEFARDCSADLLNSNEGSVQNLTLCGEAIYMTTDEFVAFGKDADYWIYPDSSWNDVYADNQAVLDTFVSVQNRKVYDYQGSGQSAWFEQRLAEYDVVLQDFCDVVGTETAIHERVWFRDVFDEAVGELPACVDPAAPLVSQATTCIPIADTGGGIPNAGGNQTTEPPIPPPGGNNPDSFATRCSLATAFASFLGTLLWFV